MQTSDSLMMGAVDWSGLEGEWTITYLDGERRPRRVPLWNPFEQVDAARELIRAGEPLTEPPRRG